MSQNTKASVEINLPIEVAEIKDKTPQEATGFVQEMPTVTTLLQRKKLAVTQSVVAKKPANSAEVNAQASAEITIHGATESPQIQPSRRRSTRIINVEEEQAAAEATKPVEMPTRQMAPTQTLNSFLGTKGTAVTAGNKTGLTLSKVAIRKKGEPPPFRNMLQVEAITIKEFEKSLGKYKKSANLKKLACLEYFSTYFNEIAFFSVTQPGSVQGVLGFGTVDLVSGIKNCGLTPALCPSISDLLAQGESFCGAAESLRAEDAQALASMGFKQLAFLGIFPISFKKELLGVWICTAATIQEVPEKELKTLKKLLANLQFEPS